MADTSKCDETIEDSHSGKTKTDNETSAKKVLESGDICQAEIDSKASKQLHDELEKAKEENLELRKKIENLQIKLDNNRNELEREVQKRCEMEQGFTEDAKRSSDQIEELISKSNQDDNRISDFEKRIEFFAKETSSMIESFTTNREMLTSQLQELRYENDFLLGKFLAKNRELQNEVIDLPQTVDELQFHCLNLSERLILATLAKERLEETLTQLDRNHQ